MDRRRFLQIFGGGVVASATMAEAGFLADFMAWLKRKPVWSIPKTLAVNPYIAEYSQFSGLSQLATIYYDRKAIENLRANLMFQSFSDIKPLPEQREKSIQMIRFAQAAFEL